VIYKRGGLTGTRADVPFHVRPDRIALCDFGHPDACPTTSWLESVKLFEQIRRRKLRLAPSQGGVDVRSQRASAR